jgi:hypothetical protein
MFDGMLFSLALIPSHELTAHLRYNIPVTFKPKWNINVFNEEIEKSATAQVKIARTALQV